MSARREMVEFIVGTFTGILALMFFGAALATCVFGCVPPTAVNSWHPDTEPTHCVAYCARCYPDGGVQNCPELCLAAQRTGLTDFHPEAADGGCR
jgi:hypothetical protein